ncbi:MAG: trehalose-6-phosphate synthase, partial [Candidatus Obscuribacterales bacterium]|nr:trehalose-6-phosphate synthase [Candidatus Obscuribacterales bacterium]
MDVVSYRGPGVAGGVSSGLGNMWRSQSDSSSLWWYMNKNTFEFLSTKSERSTFIAMLPESLIEGHYKFCNEFIWPLMHDLPEFASYNADNHEQYLTFNRIISEHIDVEASLASEFFIQDYQLALIPKWMSMYNRRTVIYWHIPFPKNVPSEFVKPVFEIVEGMLGAAAIGFHTDEYARNFMSFVDAHLSGYKTDKQNLKVVSRVKQGANSQRKSAAVSHFSYAMRRPIQMLARESATTELHVHPLGIDLASWSNLGRESQNIEVSEDLRTLADSKFILSVDRVDYTKSVLDRIQIIDKFFETHPNLVGEITFAQVCGRSRTGLQAFDKYFDECDALTEQVNNRWSTSEWKPINWIKQSLSPAELAYLYTHAQAMLVNPVRDGLNLTAKEFIACQDSYPG